MSHINRLIDQEASQVKWLQRQTEEHHELLDHRTYVGVWGGGKHIENLHKNCSSIGSRRRYGLVCRNWRGTSCVEAGSRTELWVDDVESTLSGKAEE
jgi:hypothetical protein